MELSINDLRELFGNSQAKNLHPLHEKKVVAVLPNGFIHFGTLHDLGDRYRLSAASNLRYWAKRSNGLPEFAKNGPEDEDRIDKAGDIYFDDAVFFYKAGAWL